MSTAVATFSLAALAKEVVDEADGPDPDAIVKVLVDRIPKRFYREALEQSCRAVVTQELRKHRRVGDEPDDAPQGPVRSQGSVSRPGASRWTQYASGIALTFLRRAEQVGGEWKYLADCTRDDVLACAATRTTMAAGNAREAARLRLLADEMERAGAETVADLSETVLAAIARMDVQP